MQPPGQHIPYREVGGGDGGGLFVGDVIGDGVGVGGGDGDVFGIAAVDGAAEELGAAAEVVLPGEADGALLAGEAGVD